MINHLQSRPPIRVLVLLLVFSSLLPLQALALEIVDLRIGVYEKRTRIVIEMDAKADFNVFTLGTPYRAVIYLPEANWRITEPEEDKGLVNSIRYGMFTNDQSRVVIDLKKPAKIHKKFMLKPSASSQNYRLVVDLVAVEESEFVTRQTQTRAQVEDRFKSKIEKLFVQRSDTNTPIVPKERPKRDHYVIVIDPGHGGVDPGAHGRKAKEKNVVLAFAKEFAQKLKSTGRYDVFLTRNTDVYIPLRERVRIGRRKKADLFISIHADAIKKRNVRGLSIYTLSENASDKEAAALARKENQSDIIAGIDFGNQPPDVTNILIDLAQRETKNLSKRFAGHVVEKTQGTTRLLDRTHRQAGFRVLKAPDVPSVLIELGFLTNRSDEKQLLSSKWQKNVSTALTRAINAYFADKNNLASNQ